MVLAVLIAGISQLLDAALRLAQVLLTISKPPALSIKLGFELPDPGLHLVHGLLASLKSVGLSLIQLVLHLLGLGLQQTPLLLCHLSVILLRPELISQAGSINHGLGSLVLAQLSLSRHLIKVSMQSLHLRVHLPLGSSDRLVSDGSVGQRLIDIGELLLSVPAGLVSLLKESPSLFKGVVVSKLVALACSRFISSSATSASSFFFILVASALPLLSVSSAFCMASRPLVMFFLVPRNSSSFSAILRSISWRT